MYRLPRLRLACLAPVVVAACLCGTGCDPVDSPPARPVRFKAPLPSPRRTDHPDPENAKWLAAWRDTRARIAEMQEKLSEAQKFHGDAHLDAFLELDPESLGKDQLCHLFHFLDRGYFTVERQIAIDLLERRLNRNVESEKPKSPGVRSFKERIAAAMQRDELRIVDIETALNTYHQPDDADFRIPEHLSEEETADLISAVSARLEETRTKVAAMDDRIAALKARVFNLPEPEPREQASPVSSEPPEGPAAPAEAAPESDGAAPGSTRAADAADLANDVRAAYEERRNAVEEDRVRRLGAAPASAEDSGDDSSESWPDAPEPEPDFNPPSPAPDSSEPGDS